MLAVGCTYDDFPARSRTGVVRLLAQRTDHSGRLHLADHLLESAAEIETEPIEAGRILFDRGRVARKLGRLDLSLEQYQQLLRDARKAKSPELAARAHYGLAAVAQTRGNFAECRAQDMRLIRIARGARLNNLLAGGYSGLATMDSMGGRYGDAVAHFWKAYQLVEGQGQIGRSVLGNLAQTLLVSGRPHEAKKVATIVLQAKPPLLSAMPVLGTLAIASAQVRDPGTVRWAHAQLRSIEETRTDPYNLAQALIECAAALETLGERADATAMRQRAEALAERYGFHGLTFQEAMLSVQLLAEPHRFHAAAAEAAAAIVDLDTPVLPRLLATLPA
jgi:tetratricopeptide (TPR) repeat protein